MKSNRHLVDEFSADNNTFIFLPHLALGPRFAGYFILEYYRQLRNSQLDVYEWNSDQGNHVVISPLNRTKPLEWDTDIGGNHRYLWVNIDEEQ